jgi:hypothetical protein
VLVLTAPRAVFVALREDSREAAGERSEQVLLVLWLAGIASVLSTATAGRLMDDHDYDALLVAIWAFLAGGLYGGFAYYAFGGFLHGGVKALGSQGSYRRSRQVFAFAAVPVALSLALWPAKLALYGADLFHRGGADAGAGGTVFGLLGLYPGRTPRFVKKYAELADEIRGALERYVADVRSGAFPEERHTYAIGDDELARFEDATASSSPEGR